MTRISIGLLLLAGLLLAYHNVFPEEHRDDCHVCGMWIDQNMHTRHVVTTRDGSQIMFCSLSCAMKFINANQSEIKRIQVADYLTAELVDAQKAVYLVDSDAPPVMSYLSFIAFRDRASAQKFQKVHGGTITDFGGVRNFL